MLEAEARGAQMQGQPRSHSHTLFQNTKQNQKQTKIQKNKAPQNKSKQMPPPCKIYIFHISRDLKV
jgi:hypothetical protein